MAKKKTVKTDPIVESVSEEAKIVSEKTDVTESPVIDAVPEAPTLDSVVEETESEQTNDDAASDEKISDSAPEPETLPADDEVSEELPEVLVTPSFVVSEVDVVKTSVPTINVETPEVKEDEEVVVSDVASPLTNIDIATDVAVVPDVEVICGWDESVDRKILSCLNTLNTVSSKNVDAIASARYSFYITFFTVLGTAKPDQGTQFLTNVLLAMTKRKHVLDRTRSSIGFSSIKGLTREQLAMYSAIWRLMVDISDPATRIINSKSINWNYVSSIMDAHKHGNTIFRRLQSFLS